MSREHMKLALAAVLAIGIPVCALLTVLMSFQVQAQQPASSSTTQARITRIQNGLLPSVIIKGQPLPATKLTDRMQYYRVPGVSIA